jgi:hypothetical protein
MRIVDFDGLVSSPKGTIFCEWEPRFLDSQPMRLVDVIRRDDGEIRDFYYCDVLAFTPNGCGPAVSNVEGRDGLFDYARKFLIWEKEDIDRVIRILTGTDTDEDGIWPEFPIEGAE